MSLVSNNSINNSRFFNLVQMPNEVLAEIFSYLDGKSLCSVASVNQLFRELSMQQDGWKMNVKQKRELHEYKQAKEVGRHWEKGQLQKRHNINLKINPSFLKLFGNIAVAAGRDGSIEMVDYKNGKSLGLLKYKHTAGLTAAEIVGDLLISGSLDTSVCIGNYKTGACEYVLKDEQAGSVTCLQLCRDNQFLISGHDNGKLLLWNIGNGQLDSSLKEHSDAITCLAGEEKFVLSGSKDMQIHVFNVQKGGKFHGTLVGHESAVSSICMRNDVAISSAVHDKTLRIWDYQTLNCRNILRGHDADGIQVQISGNIAFSYATSDSALYLWHVKNGFLISTLELDKDLWSGVEFLRIYGDTAVLTGVDGSFTVWDYKKQQRCQTFTKGDLEICSKKQIYENYVVAKSGAAKKSTPSLEVYQIKTKASLFTKTGLKNILSQLRKK